MSIAVITGSASGIGAAVRTRFEKEGYKVIGVDIKNTEVIADLSTKSGRESAIAGVKQHCGDFIDRFVACAGLATYVRPLTLIPSVNYFGAIDLLDGLLEFLKCGRDPAAVAILSNSALWMPTDSPYIQALLNHDEEEAWRVVTESEKVDDPVLSSGMAYAASKFALGRALRQRALSWGKLGIRLNGVAPGNIDTPMLEKVLEDPNTGDFVRNTVIPIGSFGKPEEIAAVVYFLCSPEASHVHGSILVVDGGIDANVRQDRF